MAHQNDVYQNKDVSDARLLDQVVSLLSQGVDGGDNPLASVLCLLLNQAMRLEREQFLGAAEYERTEERRGYANGFKPKTVQTRLGALPVQIPQVRSRGYDEGQSLEFYPSALEKGVRSERALKLALAEMYVQGVSTRKVTKVLQEMCGLEVSSTQVSRVAKLLDQELEAWRNRPLGEVVYLLLDARYEKVRVHGAVTSCAVLVAVGVTAQGRRSVLGVSVSMSEAEVHWREFLAALQERGLYGVRMVTSDNHAGLKAALRARFAGVPWQRCQFHLQQNAMHQVNRQSLRGEVAGELRGVLQSSDYAQAQDRLRQMVSRYEKSQSKLAAWLEENVPESLTVLSLPESHRRLLRTTNGVERLNKEIKRRTRVATLFPNEASLLRLVTAVLMEASEEWECGRIYITLSKEAVQEETDTA
jgi:putative transposase